eukprot:TRINITY_DN2482_c0_g2_i3.p2 TRINITY_DN2482_c0_g2~~TRINITY_DN2482_c0_g2_i3.p2  ORF type:complete len:108 (+),score=12.60 TRINITY_DN2482_c0_g2_i3:446-769(+)
MKIGFFHLHYNLFHGSNFYSYLLHLKMNIVSPNELKQTTLSTKRQCETTFSKFTASDSLVTDMVSTTATSNGLNSKNLSHSSNLFLKKLLYIYRWMILEEEHCCSLF